MGDSPVETQVATGAPITVEVPPSSVTAVARDFTIIVNKQNRLVVGRYIYSDVSVGIPSAPGVPPARVLENQTRTTRAPPDCVLEILLRCWSDELPGFPALVGYYCPVGSLAPTIAHQGTFVNI